MHTSGGFRVVSRFPWKSPFENAHPKFINDGHASDKISIICAYLLVKLYMKTLKSRF